MKKSKFPKKIKINYLKNNTIFYYLYLIQNLIFWKITYKLKKV